MTGTTDAPDEAPDDRLLHARVLVELGELQAAEQEVVQVLDESPEDLSALNLFAKIKHMKGEISQAVGCWAQIHGRSPHNENALMHLAAILHLVQDPARGADEFVALNQFQLVRKPRVQLELEKAFRLFLARRPAEAQALCGRLAQKYRSSDREMYKLAVLAQAWIAELAGDGATACAVLEALGQERGFETDTDRVLFLVRLYERIGTPEKLRAALNICRYLQAHFEKMSVLSRLAAIYRKLGKTALAEEHERRFLEAFRRRMHRPSFREIARLASRRYVPLVKLRRLAGLRPEVDPGAGPRERAVALALGGDVSAAAELLQGGQEVLDAKYRADLLVLQGREEEAAAGYLDVLRSDPDDLDVLGWLLDRHRLHGVPELAAVLRGTPAGARALEGMRSALRAAPLEAALWRRLAVLARLVGNDEEAARAEERALTVEEAARRRARPVGRVLAAAVYHFVGKAKGLIHEVWADRKPVQPGQGGFLADEDILANLTPDLMQAVRNIFLAVREYARSKFPHLTRDILDYRYTYKVTKEDEPSGGLSAGLPSALAFLSVFLQQPVPQDIAYSGMIVADSHDVLVLRRIGEAEYKVKGAYNRNLRVLVLPLDNRPDLLSSREVPRAICEELVRYASSLDEVVRLTFGESIWM